MKKLLLPLLVSICALLGGCPDSKMPKVPSSTPEPKASVKVVTTPMVQALVQRFRSAGGARAPA